MIRRLVLLGLLPTAVLAQSLDLSRGEIAQNLDALYDYICRQLLLAHVPRRRDVLPHVSALLTEIRDAWAAIPKNAQSANPAGAGRRLT